MVELLLGRAAVACPFDRGRIDEIGGEPGDLVCCHGGLLSRILLRQV
jgi:hypothetical protein